MVTETRKVFALAALIIATGIATVEMTRHSAQADPMVVAGGAEGYAGKRVDATFNLVATMPQEALVSLAVARKGDLLPVACTAESAAAGCVATTFEVASAKPAVVVEKRGTSSSILIRLSRITVAGF